MDFYSLPDDVVSENIIKQLQGNDVLTVLRVSKTWNRFVSNEQLIKEFACHIQALTFLFNRIWLKDLLDRSDYVFKLSSEQYQNLYTVVYYMTINNKNTDFKQMQTISKFALDLNKKLTMRYYSDKVMVKKCITYIFRFIDAFYFRRFNLPLIAEQVENML